MRSAKAFPHCLLAIALLGSICALCTPASMAQSSAIAPRITTNVNETRLTALKGNVPHLARAEYDQGAADGSTQLTNMRLVLSRSSEQQASLNAYLASLQDKSSSNYHKWLTPAQFGKLYGPADSDVAALVAWLESHGLKLEAVSAGRTNISFSGAVSQVEEAFHTPIHSFQANGRQFYSNTADPSIPTALTTVVKGVARLNTIQPRPQYVPGKTGKFDPATGRLRAVSASTSKLRPQLTYEDSYGGQYLYVTPADAATIYNTPNSYNLNYSSSTSYTGSGVTIGIAGDSAIETKYVTAYRSLFLGDTTAPTITNLDNVAINDDAIEAYLDLEIAGGMAPGATIHFYTANSLDAAIEQALSDNTVDILSLSFGECEQDMSTSDNQLIEGWWQLAASEGIAVTVSSGDSGSAGCDYTTDSNGNDVTAATGGLQVNGLASTPYNIAVGGTDYYVLLSDFSTYATEATSTSSTAGSSSTYYRTAKSYIPESTWNDSTYSNTTISANEPWTAYSSYSSYANIAAGSGGASNCSTNTTSYSGSTTNVGSCTSGYSKPSWQTGTGVPADGARDIPDISLLAADGMDDATWLVCYPYTYQGTSYQGCIKQSDNSWYFGGVGGTSASAPAFAGILALVQQKTGDRLGQAAQTLYELYNGSHSSDIFHDVTVGNISVPCTSGTADCALNTAGYYFESGYDTTTGYDLATGLGSVDATKLVNYWNTATGTGTTAATVTVTPASSSIASTDSLSVVVTVASSATGGTTPTGTVTLSGGGYTSSTETLVSGSYTFTVPAGSLTVGSDTLTASYSGDATYAAASNTASVTVTESSTPAATFSLSATSPSASIAPGGSTTSAITVSTSTGYVGTVTLNCALTSYPSGASYKPSCSVSPTTVTLSSSTTSGTATATITTTATTTSSLASPKLPGKNRGVFGAAGGALLAFVVFLGIPARRRSWRSMLGVLVLMTMLGSLTACDGGGSSSNNNNTGTAGTTAGTYTFTVTGTGSDSATTTETGTFTVTVN